MKIWGRANSSNVQKVMWAAAELGLTVQRIDAGGAFGITRTPEYLAMNPNALVPTLEEDDGWSLWESHAILRYLAGLHGAGSLLPDSPRSRAEADRWMDWLHTTLGPPMTVVFWQIVRVPAEQKDAQALATATARCIELYGQFDRALSGRSYIADERLTIGDIAVAVHVNRWLRLVEARPAMAALEAWHARIAARPAYREHVSGIPIT